MDFLKLLHQLQSHNVDFVLVGGYASMLAGSDMLTQDLDICISLTNSNLHRLYDAIAPLNPRYRMGSNKRPLIRTDIVSPLTKNLYMTTDAGTLDCLGSIMGIGDYKEVLAQSFELDLEFGIIKTLTIHGLIQSKSAMNRPKDVETVKKLKAIQERLKENE